MNQPPVIAAICHYNMTASLLKLLQQVQAQHYDRIYVLDDASTDRSVEALAKRFDNVDFILGRRNLGPAGNRNRLIKLKHDLPPEALIHFLDADVKLISRNMPAIIRRKFRELPNQLIGGLVVLPNGQPSVYNYGPRHSIYASISGIATLIVERVYRQSPARAAKLYARFHWLLKDWPNLSEPASRRPIFWCEEANLVVPYRIFKQVGGYDSRLRYHEIQDLAIRLDKLNVQRFFDAAIAVEHPFFRLDRKRWLRQHKADWQMIAKHGLHLK